MTRDEALIRIGDELAGIRRVLELMIQPDPIGAAVGCLHPDEKRVHFGGMGESDGFQCRACGETVESVKLS